MICNCVFAVLVFLSLALWSQTCSGVPLDTAQYNALVTVYEQSVPKLSTSSYPRFAANGECTGAFVKCAGGKVTLL